MNIYFHHMNDHTNIHSYEWLYEHLFSLKVSKYCVKEKI